MVTAMDGEVVVLAMGQKTLVDLSVSSAARVPWYLPLGAIMVC